MFWNKLKANPIFTQEEMRIKRRSWRWILIFLIAWAPFNFVVRQYFENQPGTMFGYTLLYLGMLLRADMIFAVLIGWSLTQDLLNNESRRDLRLTQCSSKEVVSGKVLPYILLMICFQYGGVAATYYSYLFEPYPSAVIPISNHFLQGYFGTSMELPVASLTVFFAVFEDCLYAALALIVFTKSFLNHPNIFKALIVGLLQMSLVLIPVVFTSVIFYGAVFYLLKSYTMALIFNEGLYILVSSAWFFTTILPIEALLIYLFYAGLKRRYHDLYDSEV